jgi:hypothetical protein
MDINLTHAGGFKYLCEGSFTGLNELVTVDYHPRARQGKMQVEMSCATEFSYSGFTYS